MVCRAWAANERAHGNELAVVVDGDAVVAQDLGDLATACDESSCCTHELLLSGLRPANRDKTILPYVVAANT